VGIQVVGESIADVDGCDGHWCLLSG
jgi:hypothetical protein